jgi:hypothetical protein
MSLAILVVVLWVIAPVLLYLIGTLAAAIVGGKLTFIGVSEKTGPLDAKPAANRDGAGS